MFEILGQMNVSEVAASAAGGAGLTIAALLIKRGFHLDVGKTDGKANGTGVSVPLCDAKMETIKVQFTDLKSDVDGLKVDVRDGFKGVREAISCLERKP